MHSNSNAVDPTRGYGIRTTFHNSVDKLAAISAETWHNGEPSREPVGYDDAQTGKISPGTST